MPASSHRTVWMPDGKHWDLPSGMMQTVLRIALYMISQRMGIHLGYVRYKFLFLVELMDLVDSRTLYPPQHTCINPSCERCQSGHLLKKEEQRQAVLYTLDKGAIPVRSVHLYCDSELSQLIGSTSVDRKQCLLVIFRVQDELSPQLSCQGSCPYILWWNPRHYSGWGTLIYWRKAHTALDNDDVGLLVSPDSCRLQMFLCFYYQLWHSQTHDTGHQPLTVPVCTTSHSLLPFHPQMIGPLNSRLLLSRCGIVL